MKTATVAVLTALCTLSTASPARGKRQFQADSNLDVSSSLQNILSNTHGSDLYAYPTDLTRGIIPASLPLSMLYTPLTNTETNPQP